MLQKYNLGVGTCSCLFITKRTNRCRLWMQLVRRAELGRMSAAPPQNPCSCQCRRIATLPISLSSHHLFQSPLAYCQLGNCPLRQRHVTAAFRGQNLDDICWTKTARGMGVETANPHVSCRFELCTKSSSRLARSMPQSCKRRCPVCSLYVVQSGVVDHACTRCNPQGGETESVDQMRVRR